MLGVFISFSSSNYWPEGLLARWACSEWRGGKLELWVLHLIKNFCCLPGKVVICLSSAWVSCLLDMDTFTYFQCFPHGQQCT